jgi:hypothetical protein
MRVSSVLFCRPISQEVKQMMDSSMIGKVEKAHRYAQERDRFQFLTFQVMVRGDNGEYLPHLRSWTVELQLRILQESRRR